MHQMCCFNITVLPVAINECEPMMSSKESPIFLLKEGNAKTIFATESLELFERK